MKKVLYLFVIGLLLTSTPVFGASTAKEESSDLWLKAKLVTTYTINEYLNPFTLDVSVKDGVATLGGTVESDVERDLAVEIARGTDGIEKVIDKITVSPETYQKETEQPAGSEFFRKVEDATITARVKSRLLWNRSTKGLDINVDTNDRVVTLNGSLNSDVNRQLAVQLARNTDGVRKVDDRLRVVSQENNGASNKIEKEMKKIGGKVTDAWITAKVKTLLLFSKEADGSDIDVSTEDGVVTLKGTVRDNRQKKEIKAMIGNNETVKSVKTDLAVSRADM